MKELIMIKKWHLFYQQRGCKVRHVHIVPTLCKSIFSYSRQNRWGENVQILYKSGIIKIVTWDKDGISCTR